jgi:hypothetical protein
MASAEAIARGLAAHTPDKPGYWIHTSGTGILTYEDFENDTFGKTATNMFDDWDNISKVMSAPDAALHRVVDKVVINAGTENSDRVKTAIVCPPCIYGMDILCVIPSLTQRNIYRASGALAFRL